MYKIGRRQNGSTANLYARSGALRISRLVTMNGRVETDLLISHGSHMSATQSVNAEKYTHCTRSISMGAASENGWMAAQSLQWLFSYSIHMEYVDGR